MLKTSQHLSSILSTVLFVGIFTAFTLAENPAVQKTEPHVYKADPVHSYVSFKVRHLGISNVIGKFGAFDVTIEMDPADLSSLKVNATIDVKSIDTENTRRDNDLKSEKFFDAQKFGQLIFVSKAVRNIDGEDFELVGDLTLKDITKEVVLKGTFLGRAEIRDTGKIAFEATTKINRFDYGLKWDRLTEAGGLMVGETVRISLDIEAGRQ